ncbi:MAG: MFS transporter [Actinomycetota bacterium]
MGPTNRSLAVFTAAKAVSNTALRWAPPFLPTLERAFGASTAQLATALGVAEAGGLSTLAIGRRLDRGQERRIAIVGIGVVAIGALVALIGTTATFAVSAFLVVVGVANLTTAGHAWLGRRVPYDRRARAIGVFETSWALSLLVGAPIVAGLIAVFGWRGPYVAFVLGCTVAALLLVRYLDHDPIDPPATPGSTTIDPADPAHRSAFPPATTRPDAAAWATMGGSALTAMAGLSVFAISGAWLDDAFGVPTGGLGLVAMGFGAIELLSSISSAGFADRLGKRRTTIAALVVLALGLAIMTSADDSLAVGIVGLLAFLCGFEYAIVTSFSLVSEAMPTARGVTISYSNAIGTLARSVGVITSGVLYEAHGIGGTVALSAVATVGAIALLTAGRRS